MAATLLDFALRGPDFTGLSQTEKFDALLKSGRPVLALAPMQDVTDLPFWKLMARYGGPDIFFTEYFRVHSTSHLEKYILQSIVENPDRRPAIAQMIGNDIPSLVRTAKQLQHYPIAGIDLNLGCPAPVVYRKCAGGGLLRELDKVDSIVGALRDAISVKFTVKTRIGFDETSGFERLLAILAKHSPDLVTVHGRTVLEMYKPVVHYDFIKSAAQFLSCPVLANGNVDCVETARWVMDETGADGLMIGRGAIRNPWIFEQIRHSYSGETSFVPKGRDVLAYVRDLYESVKPPLVQERALVQKMKKYMNYIAVGVDSEGQFLHQIRRVERESEFFAVCERFLDHPQEMFVEPAFNPPPVQIA
jgi:tRNA-dihydrouridine synthase B